MRRFSIKCFIFSLQVIRIGHCIMVGVCSGISIFTVVGLLVSSFNEVRLLLPDRLLIFTNWGFAAIMIIMAAIGVLVIAGTTYMIRGFKNELK